MASERTEPLLDFLQRQGTLTIGQVVDVLDGFLRLGAKGHKASTPELVRIRLNLFPEQENDALNTALKVYAQELATGALEKLTTIADNYERHRRVAGFQMHDLPAISVQKEYPEWGNRGIDEADTETPSTAIGAYAAAMMARNIMAMAIFSPEDAEKLKPAVVAAKNMVFGLTEGNRPEYPIARYAEQWKQDMAQGLKFAAGRSPLLPMDNYQIAVSSDRYMETRMQEIDHALDLLRQEHARPADRSR